MTNVSWFVTHIASWSRTLCGLAINEVVTTEHSAPTCLWCAVGRSMLTTYSSGYNSKTRVVR